MHDNDTRLDLYHNVTAGDYDGLDRFGRIVDMKHTEFSGSAVDFDEFEYGYDRYGNRTYREDVIHATQSYEYQYNDLYQLTTAKTGFLNDNNQVENSDVSRVFGLDLLGNLDDFDRNTVEDVINHTTNETNEITKITKDNPGGAAEAINDDFGGSGCDQGLKIPSGIWVEAQGDFGIANESDCGYTVSSLDGNNHAVAQSEGIYTGGAITVDVTFPSSSSTNKAGAVFAHDGDDSFHAVVINRNTSKLELYEITDGNWSSALASSSNTFTINDDTAYTVKVFVRQQRMEAEVVNQSNSPFNYSPSGAFAEGGVGMYSDKTGVTFHDFVLIEGGDRVTIAPRWVSTADVVVQGELLPYIDGYIQVKGATWGREAILEDFHDDDYIVEYDVNLQSGSSAALVRYVDPNNHYRIELDSSNVNLYRVLRGERSTALDSGTHSETGDIPVRILVSGTTIKVWVNNTQKINTTDPNIADGGFAITGDQPKFDNIKIGYDENADDDISDAGDTIVYELNVDMDESQVIAFTTTYDNNGNLTYDGSYY